MYNGKMYLEKSEKWGTAQLGVKIGSVECWRRIGSVGIFGIFVL
jgi:hypothetical protein